MLLANWKPAIFTRRSINNVEFDHVTACQPRKAHPRLGSNETELSPAIHSIRRFGVGKPSSWPNRPERVRDVPAQLGHGGAHRRGGGLETGTKNRTV